MAFIGGVITSVCLSLVLPQFVFRESILLVTKVITSVGLFEVVRMLEWKDGQYYSIIRNMSTILYFIHMYVWTGYYMLVYKTQTYGWDSFLVTTGLSMLVAWMYLIIKRNKTSSKNNVR